MHPARHPKALSPRRFRTLLGLFPPFLLSRTRVVRVAEDFRACRVVVRPSLLTRNLQGSMFGGTIFAAADPFFALLYWQVFAHRGIRLHAWTRSARIEYRKPVSTPLTIDFELTVDDLRDAGAALDRDGRFSRVHGTQAIDESGAACAVIELEVYLRLPGDSRRGTATP